MQHYISTGLSPSLDEPLTWMMDDEMWCVEPPGDLRANYPSSPTAMVPRRPGINWEKITEDSLPILTLKHYYYHGFLGVIHIKEISIHDYF